MFRSHSPYSPFFTSGLLSEPISESRKRPAPEDQSAVYLDIVFNDDDHYRSFLSLDLAETQSMRSASLKRKVSSKYTTRSSAKVRSEITRISEVSSLNALPPLPSPKPIPSGTLQNVSRGQTRSPLAVAPRLPSLPPLPSIDLDLPASPKLKTFSTKKSIISPGSSNRPLASAPSIASSRTRSRNRAAALAHLEGRRSKLIVGPLPSRQIPKNFMIMSDDDDDDDEEEEEEEGKEEGTKGNSVTRPDCEYDDDWLSEPEDIVLPLSPTLKARSSSPRRSRSNPLREELSPKRKATQRRGKNGPNKSEWFALKSFIDLYNDNDDTSDLTSSNWNWRSFIEVASLS